MFMPNQTPSFQDGEGLAPPSYQHQPTAAAQPCANVRQLSTLPVLNGLAEALEDDYRNWMASAPNSSATLATMDCVLYMGALTYDLIQKVQGAVTQLGLTPIGRLPASPLDIVRKELFKGTAELSVSPADVKRALDDVVKAATDTARNGDAYRKTIDELNRNLRLAQDRIARLEDQAHDLKEAARRVKPTHATAPAQTSVAVPEEVPGHINGRHWKHAPMPALRLSVATALRVGR